MKFFRVAVEGATIDGRIIKRDWLTQAAANYDTTVYGARVWVEHLRSAWADSPFSAQGDVVELKAEVIKGGKLDGKMALYAAIEPLQDLVKLTKSGKKIYTSIEIKPKFADTGEAYVTGLAVTDEPASLGTEILKFRAKSDQQKFTSEYMETEMSGFDDDDDDDDGDEKRTAKGGGMLDKIRAKFRKLSGRQAESEHFSQDTRAAFVEVGELLETVVERVEDVEASAKKFAKLQKEHDALRQDFSELKEALSKQDGGGSNRPAATGQENGELKADC